MSDYTELQKAAAYAAQDAIKFADEDEEIRALQQFHEEVDPETVLALIAENERLGKERITEHQSLRSDRARNSLYMMIATSLIDDHPYERGGSDWDYEHPIHDKIISLLAERDQLRAEVAGLRTGYEAYERVNAELKAENEALRNALMECTDSLQGEMLQKFGGQLPEDMHPVTRREYDRDIAEVSGYRAALGQGDQP